MGLHSHANTRDGNERQVIAALRGVGVSVELLDIPVDLLFGINFGRGGRHTGLMEVKTPGSPLTEDQIEFIKNWRGAPVGVVETAQAAVDFVKTEFRFWVKVDRGEPASCWEWQGARLPQGYGVFQLAGKSERAHRVSWTLSHKQPIPDKMMVLHHCDNPPCVNPAHLFLGTALDNARDCQKKGRGRDQNGEKHNLAVLTAKQVAQIRSKTVWHRGEQRKLAKELGVSDVAIHNVRNYKSWRAFP